MEITWYGHSCFRLVERNLATVITDPYDSHQIGYEPLNTSADIVTVSHESAGHSYTQAVKGDPRLITGPGEYEIGGVFITGVQTNSHTRLEAEEPRNTLYVFDYNGLTIAHLGDMSHVPTQSEVEALGAVNVALVPVGSGGGLNAAKAAEVISLLEPNIVIPMHYATTAATANLDPLSKFLKEMGLAEFETLASLKISNAKNLPEETKVIVLDYLNHG
jgi:L-ascorbate metabolism protein UlaG (beta-lactamase superfamily)